MTKQLFKGFRFMQQASTYTRAVYEGKAIRFMSCVSVIEPAEISWDELAAWVRSKARMTDDEWTFSDEQIGVFDSMGDEDFEALVCEVATWLYEAGGSVTPGTTDHTAYQYADQHDDQHDDQYDDQYDEQP